MMQCFLNPVYIMLSHYGCRVRGVVLHRFTLYRWIWDVKKHAGFDSYCFGKVDLSMLNMINATLEILPVI